MWYPSYITQISQDSCKITLSDSYWTIHRNSWAGDTPIRLSYKYHTHRSFVLMNESPAILKHVNSLIPEFRKMIQRNLEITQKEKEKRNQRKFGNKQM